MVSRPRAVIFPLAYAALTVILDGVPLRSYEPARLRRGHIVAPIAPYIVRTATRIEVHDGVMTVRRESFTANIRIASASMDALERTFVRIAPIYRALGERCTYDPRTRTLTVRTPRVQDLRTMEPYDSNAPWVQPTRLFTPEPVVTPRPTFSGSPRPRRTPIPVLPSRP